MMLETLRASWVDCELCGLCWDRKQIVWGEGHATSPLVIVAEAPGATEDETGVVFSGISGILLRRVLRRIGIPFELHFAANLVMCRPPGNRNPAWDEVTACSDRLAMQIEIVRPRVLLILGSVAVRMLLGYHSLSEARCEQREIGWIPKARWPQDFLGSGAWGSIKRIVVGYHPSYTVRQDSRGGTRRALRLLAADLTRAKQALEATA